MNAFSRTLPATVDTQERWAALLTQLQVAVSATPRAELERWLLDAFAHTGKVGVRRVRSLGQLVHDIARRMFDETAQAVDAYKNDGLVESLNEQGRRFAGDAGKLAHRVSAQVGGLVSMASNPAKLPEAVVLVLAAFVTSGGVDADGGVPDLDLTLGIGAHRSIFTHSIISGTLVEGALFAACTLVGMVHRQLPTTHDPLFDFVETNRTRYLQLATTGASLGIAYHLGLDASFQPGAYHDLPFSMPMECHEWIMGANASAEGLDAAHKPGPSPAPRQARETSAAHTSATANTYDGRARRIAEPSPQPVTLPTLPLSDAIRNGTKASLTFGWLLAGKRRALVIIVPDKAMHAQGKVRLFDATSETFLTSDHPDIWARLTLLGPSERGQEKEMLAAYRRAITRTRASGTGAN